MMEMLILTTMLHENTLYFLFFPSLKPLGGGCPQPLLHDTAPVQTVL